MTYACKLTEIPKHQCPDLIQFYSHFPHKYPYLFTSSSQSASSSADQESSQFDILFIEPEQWLKLDHQKQLSSSPNINFAEDGSFLDNFDRLFFAEEESTEQAIESELPFTGGWFMFLAYELAQQVEPCLKLTFEKQLLPIAYAARVKKALIYDHKKECLFFMTESDMDHQRHYQSLLADMQFICQQSSKSTETDVFNFPIVEETADSFLIAVDTVKSYIKEGDVFQVNLSRLWQSTLSKKNNNQKHTEQVAVLSQLLAQENPAPFSGVASFNSELCNSKEGEVSIVSSSPERLLRVKNKRLESRPIAGTRPRSTSLEEDLRLLKELHDHPKEQAEHIMLIDLIRNDLGRVCKPGSVVVDELMVNETYAHVHHIVSNVSGELQTGKTPGEILKAMFPGGTITGCPKVRCMEIIAELEQCSRGAYTGSMGYINLDGSMDFNILIRTFVIESLLDNLLEESAQRLSFRAGAGLVFDSIAEKELHETRAKAKGLLQALKAELK
ncbi:aminodeoxychorismate synthase component I [sulfur-oxidizing endosymbiont of Gigantopelta aegis]|uniref:aminodeoxychorismate synthase component I n=1 Tax=sulfur-oxidizing endosymbiont of Gigantopelta aegis TaxID=2794934 RepID=UPI0018DCB128|nr:aminodeoxychorismate synthase component I [sulfur-oxidizing endosymbiont of Gigantopelta aegis]